MQYLFMWRSDDPDDDLGEYFEQILDHLKTPLLHSMDAFLLPDTHDRIRCFREALRSGPGLMVRRERAREPDFWNWGESRVRDLTCHLAFREGNGIEERARWLTNWSTRGRKQVAPGLWPELADCWKMRMLDMVDCFGSTASKCLSLYLIVFTCLSPRHLPFQSVKSGTVFLVTQCTIRSHGISPRM